MITFYPGPSKVSSKVSKYFQDAVLDGVLSINHRSPEFVDIYTNVSEALKEKLLIPEDYVVLFASSATECWEIIAQSLITSSSFHIYNGAFGEKWFDYTKKLKPDSQEILFDMQKVLDIKNLTIPSSAELIAITQNETSNGTALDNSTIKTLRDRFPEPLIAVDATSSMAGIQLDFLNADVWYASVQKCFGLPAGLAVMVCSPKAIERARAINERGHYNSLPFMLDMAEKYQTTYTPNVLNIYMLMRVLADASSISETTTKTHGRYKQWLEFFSEIDAISLLIEDDRVRSKTVLALTASEDEIANMKIKAKQAGITLGNGYGNLKSNTIRIANFPAIKNKEIQILMEFFRNHLS